MYKLFLLISSFSGFMCVVLGAFGAHALKKYLSTEDISVFETGVRYQFFHTLALLGIALLLSKEETSIIKMSGYCFTAGIVLFSGSLYFLSLRNLLQLNLGWMGIITPFGGLFFITGWLLLFLFALKK